MATATRKSTKLKTRKPRKIAGKKTKAKKGKPFASLTKYDIQECVEYNCSPAEKTRVTRFLNGKKEEATIDLGVDDLPDNVWLNLMEQNYLEDEAATIIKKRLSETPTTVLIASATEMFSYFRRRETDSPSYEILYNGRYYPIRVSVNLYNTFFGPVLYIAANVRVGHIKYDFQWKLTDAAFFEGPDPIQRTVKDVLSDFNMRVSEIPQADYIKLLRETEATSKLTGKQLLSTGEATTLVSNGWFNVLDIHPFGKDGERRVVIEDQIERENYENDKGTDRDEDNIVKWPFLRVFSFDMKRYVYVDIRDVKDYVFDENAIDTLVLPDEMSTIIHKVFDASNDKLFGDTIAGRHGGLVVLAAGGPGVGKTMTAEAFAEHTKRPLYSMEIGELGVQLEKVEEKLGIIFRRAARWNAVLLLDEADVFMMKRGEDLERSAIVGVFLRLLDYFHGMLFLTTNRPESMDEAFKSRVTLKLQYPELTQEIRTKIWGIMIDSAKMCFAGYGSGQKPDGFEKLGDLTLNGRQVRNIVRLAKIADGAQIASVDRLIELAGYAAQ